MKNTEYLTKALASLNVSESDIEIILFKAGLNGDATVDLTACDTAIYNRMSIVLKGMTQNVSEGGYSVQWNMEAVKMYYNSLCLELGKPNVLSQRRVRDMSNMW